MARGLPGKREEAYLAGMIPRTFIVWLVFFFVRECFGTVVRDLLLDFVRCCLTVVWVVQSVDDITIVALLQLCSVEESVEFRIYHIYHVSQILGIVGKV